MYKHVLIPVVVVLGFGHAMRGQNLVPNHDFSQKKTCTKCHLCYKLETYLSDWFTPPYTSGDSIYGVPNTRHPLYDTCYGADRYGYDTLFNYNKTCALTTFFRPFPKESNGYLWLSFLDSFNYQQANCYWENPPCSNTYTHWPNYQKDYSQGRSFAEVQIAAPLLANKEYVIEFYCTKALEEGNNVAMKSIGALVSQDTFRHFDYKKNVIVPTVEHNHYIYDDKNWQRVIGSFIAKGNEKFLTIGNFRTDNNSDYQFTPSDTNNCNQQYFSNFVDAVYLYLHTDTLFEVTLPPDTTLCMGEDLELFAMHDDGFKLEDSVKTFLWSTGSTDSSIIVNTPGQYWVRVEYNHRFWDSDTMYIEPQDTPYSSGLATYEEGCQGDAITLNANPDIERILLWNTGLVANQITVRDSGYYWLSAISVCDTMVDSVLVNLINCDTLTPPLPVYIPNAFSPNGDGVNDFWEIANLPEKNEVIVWNRWGQVMFNQKGYQSDWSGTDKKGNKLPLGVYVYKVIYWEYPGIQRIQQGWVTILE